MYAISFIKLKIVSLNRFLDKVLFTSTQRQSCVCRKGPTIMDVTFVIQTATQRNFEKFKFRVVGHFLGPEINVYISHNVKKKKTDWQDEEENEEYAS